MVMVKETLKDFVSGVGVRKFAERPKRRERKELGQEYTDFLLDCIFCVAGREIEDQLDFQENRPVDIVWRWQGKKANLSLGMEAKRLMKTKFKNIGHAKAWLMREGISRFYDYYRETGKLLNTRIICITELIWEDDVDVLKQKEWRQELLRFLIEHGFYLIETGQIETVWERTIAEGLFLNQFTDILIEVCGGDDGWVG